MIGYRFGLLYIKANWMLYFYCLDRLSRTIVSWETMGRRSITYRSSGSQGGFKRSGV
jgi:hypothetical protein